MRSAAVLLCYLTALTVWAQELTVPEKPEEVPVPPFIDLNNIDFSQAPDEHEVVTGDTLWDLSEKYLKSPWYWPKVWSNNPQVKNPHLIYPGDKLYFKGTGEIIMPPTEGIKLSDGMELTEDAETDELARTGKTLDDKPDNYKDFVKLGGKYRIDRYKNIDATLFDISQRGFISEIEYAQTSSVAGAFDPKELLSNEDTCYVKSGKRRLSIGGYVEFFRVEEKIRHPKTRDIVGRRVEILGKGKVMDVNKDGIATVKIVKAFSAIEREDGVRDWVDYAKNIEITDFPSTVNATILTSYDPIVFYGEGHIVFIDKGSKDGLREGNMMIVQRRSDGLDAADSDDLEKFPYEKIGELVVVKADTTTSVAMITKSVIAFERGDIATGLGNIE